jgi:hypothetical protein
MGIAILMLVGFASLIAERAISASKDQDIERLRAAVQDVKSEILLASAVSDGYRREFIVPDLLEGIRNYTITIQNRTIIGRIESSEVSARAVTTQGDVVKGTNVIRKTGGVVCLNAACA